MPRWQPCFILLFLLLAIAGLALAWRCHHLGAAVLSPDEAFSWRLTKYSVPELVQRTGADVHPPLHYLLLQGWERLWGDSPWALRGLSVFLAVLSVPLTYAVCLGTLNLGSAPGNPVSWSMRGGGLFTAFLFAVHMSQISVGRTARMYALGVFLAAWTSWLLCKALRSQKQPFLWWSAYGIACAAFAYTHYYAFFSLAAQGLVAIGYLLLRGPALGFKHLKGQAGGLAFAALLGSIWYAPWLPVLYGQVTDVKEGFWISEVTWDEVERVFFPWCTGVSYLDPWEKRLWLLMLALCLGWTFYVRKAACWFFLLQAALPWVFSLGFSVLSGRSIFYDRYLSFAQWALLGYWGTVFCYLPGWPLRFLLAGFVGLSAVFGIDLKIPESPPALAQAAQFLKEHHQPGDQVWTNGAMAVNRLRYYLSQAGLTEVQVKCPYNPFPGKGHNVHLASLPGEDLLWPGEMEKVPPRLWQAGESLSSVSPPGMKMIWEKNFSDGINRYSLALYERNGEKK